MRENEFGAQFAKDACEFIENYVGHAHEIVSDIEENNPCAKNFRRLHGLFTTIRLDLFQRHSRLTPQFGGFSALAEGETHHEHIPSARGIKSYRAARTPDKIRRMRGYDDR